VRGLMRVIGAEHPHMRAAQIDLDEATDAEQLAQQLLSGSEDGETAWRTASGSPRVCASLRCAPRSGEPRSSTMNATACAYRSVLPVI
jgi:polyketide synthase 5